MRDLSELSEDEAGLVNRAIQAYPAALSYTLDRDPPVYETASELIEEGRIERIEVDDARNPLTGIPAEEMVGYRLTDSYAEEIRRIAAEKAEGAGWN